LKYRNIKLISLLIDYLSTHADEPDLHQYLIHYGIKYPERELRALTLEVQERMAAAE
jgi:hypothetical protein